MVTCAPTSPPVGVNSMIVGAATVKSVELVVVRLVGANELIVGATPKSCALAAAPPEVVTVIGPRLVPAGTITTSAVCVALMTVAAYALNRTVLSAPGSAKFVPATVTVSPAAPKSGSKDVTVGADTVNVSALVVLKEPTVTCTVPDANPPGTAAWISVWVALVTSAARPPTLTVTLPGSSGK